MITSLQIKNFRGFKDFTLDGLDVVNLIVGKNNVGKTALLEAIFLICGSNNPQLPTLLNTLRVNDSVLVPLEGGEMWGWLFYNRDMKTPIPTSYFLSSFSRMPMAELTKLFSKLEATGRHEDIINILKILEPRLERLVVSFAGGTPNIMVDFGTKPLLPLAYMGEGINRLLSLLVAIGTTQEGGCVLIDELENGLHYSLLTKIWQAIGSLATKLKVQIIATSHSLECAKAAHEAYKEKKEYGFRLCRLERNNADIKVVKYDKEDLETSIELGWEVL